MSTPPSSQDLLDRDACCLSASSSGDVHRLSSCLARGAPSDDALSRCLAYASSKVLDGCFDLLIPFADWRLSPDEGWEPLKSAVARGRPGRAQRLIAAGASFFEPGSLIGASAANHATHPAMIEELRRALEESPSGIDASHHWALAAACAEIGAPHAQLMASLVHLGPLSAKREAYVELIRHAIRAGESDNLRSVLALSGGPTEEPWHFEDLDLGALYAPIVARARAPDVRTALMLFDLGLDPARVDDRGRTIPMALCDNPLFGRAMVASDAGAYVDAFLSRGCPVAARDNAGRDLLARAEAADSRVKSWLMPMLSRHMALAEKAQLEASAAPGSLLPSGSRL